MVGLRLCLGGDAGDDGTFQGGGKVAWPGGRVGKGWELLGLWSREEGILWWAAPLGPWGPIVF